MSGLDPSILQDFLTESGELLERLEADLVSLESTPEDPELLNRVFRALHTIKGSASFLSLANLVEVAHAAESALNAARNRVVTVTAAVMTPLLAAVDVIKVQMGQIAAGEELVAPDPGLVKTLSAIGLGTVPGGGGEAAAAPAESTPAAAAAGSGEGGVELPPGKADLLEFLLADLEATLTQAEGQAAGLGDESTRAASAAALAETGDALARSVDFFEFEPMSRLALLLRDAGGAAGTAGAEALGQMRPRLSAVLTLLREQAAGLAKKRLVAFPVATLEERLRGVCAGAALDGAARVPAGAGAEDVLRLDGVRGGAGEVAAPAAEEPPKAEAGKAESAKGDPAKGESAKGEVGKGEAGKGDGKHEAARADQTIRVEVGRLEVLMNLVGELVLQKNRISAISRQIGARGGEQSEALALSAGNLDRVTADIQLAVMRTRMQPLDKIFGKYPRLIRDLSVKTGKQLRLVIEGGETEVDKSVIEELGDPLVHLLRNSADHGVEMPEDRVKAGKSPEGTITLRASHEGSHVLVQVRDDGRGLARERIARKAVERGLATEAEVAGMTDKQVYQFIFEAGFSTADQVTDLSGRGVGMDVVRSNIRKVKGEIDLDSTPGRGAVVSIKIPLTIAIMPAMMVGVGDEIYAVPLGNVVEIVKPEPSAMVSMGRSPVLRLRGGVLPLLRGPEVLGVPSAARAPTPFAVVLEVDGRQVGLLVSRLVGQQEIVIKPLDEMCDRGGHRSAGPGPVSGATVRDDGGVSLIVDVGRLVRLADAAAA